MLQHFDPRFWKPKLIAKLMEQQEALGSERRSILILVDDIILSGKAEEQLTHLNAGSTLWDQPHDVRRFLHYAP